MKIKPSVLLGAGALLLVLSDAAQAHPGHGSGGGFGAGFLHPVSGIDHILAMVAVGLWASQVGGRAVWMLPTTFVTLMVGGGLLNGLLSRNHMDLPLVEQGIMRIGAGAGIDDRLGCEIAGVGDDGDGRGVCDFPRLRARGGDERGPIAGNLCGGIHAGDGDAAWGGHRPGTGNEAGVVAADRADSGRAIACCGVLMMMGVLVGCAAMPASLFSF